MRSGERQSVLIDAEAYVITNLEKNWRTAPPNDILKATGKDFQGGKFLK